MSHRNVFPMAVIVLLVSMSQIRGGYVEEVLQDAPVAYWRLGESDIDADIVDLTGNVGDGFFEAPDIGLEVGFPGAIVDDPDTAVQFSTTVGFGCGDCGQGKLPVGGVLDLGTYENAQITLEAWFQILPSVNDSLPGSHFNRIFHYNNFEGGQYAFGIVGDNSAGFPGQRTVFGGTGSGFDDGQGDQGIILAAEADAIPPSDEPVWHYFVAQLIQDDVRLFLDGEELGDLEDSDPIFWQAEQATIGGREQSNGSYVHPFPGLIDELAIYNKLLSPERIMAHYLTGIGEGSVPGDYNSNGELDAEDLDLQAVAIAGGQHPKEFDLTGDDLVNYDDRLAWVNDLKGTWIGDSNLDGEFNSSDLVQVFVNGKYELDELAKWADGDWNANLRFDSSDMVAAFTAGGYELGVLPPAAVSAVPEPTAALLLLSGLLGLLGLRRRKTG